ncbi:MAG: DUF995 domain-containing protein [Gammaproteobacteria bacterium]|nr:DUF995 domain-containing protein [Gammaproteobacteria bacterium]
MQAKIAKRFLILILAVGASSCVTVSGISDEVALTEAGATRLNPAQVKAHVTGKTEEWDRGGAYYMEDGQLKVIWRRAFSNGSWEVSEDGTLCYQVPHWEERCHFYMNYEGQTVKLEEGRNLGPVPLHDGDKLAALGRYNSSLNRQR